ncbi:Glutathione synthase [Trema orientale]|uniref:glutathione synthase n=1 Tax=Trema orientale TaxID=63057 RepID=A0A2P5EIY9_TREOI|nr:Glutathione synthase [Trema orientale]
MGAAHTSCSYCAVSSDILYSFSISTALSSKLVSKSSKTSFGFNPTNQNFQTHIPKPTKIMSQSLPLKSGKVEAVETQEGISSTPSLDFHGIDPKLVDKMVYDSLVWSSLHGLVVGDKSIQRSGEVPGVGMVHAPFALLPIPFPETHWKQACEVAPIFNELVDRVSLDAKFLQDSLSRTKKADGFTSRLLDIHSKMLEINKKEEIRLGLHRSDYMLDEQTKLLLQIEMNTIASSFCGLSCRVSELHRSLLDSYGELLQLNSERLPGNTAVSQFADALAKAWTEYNNPRSAVLVVVQVGEHTHNIRSLRKTLGEIDAEGELQADGSLIVDGQAIAVIYFRSGYTPNDYPTESEWRARLLMEQSSAIKCPSISYHLAGTKKIQQELAKPNVLERFLDNKEDIAKLRKCFAGLWSLDDSDIISKAIERPELFVMKPQREGGGNNIYGNDVREALIRMQKEGTEEDAAYILMQRIFPTVSSAFLLRDGICHKDDAVSELGIFGAYLRNKEKVIINEQCGYLMRTKISSSDEGGVAAGFAHKAAMVLALKGEGNNSSRFMSTVSMSLLSKRFLSDAFRLELDSVFIGYYRLVLYDYDISNCAKDDPELNEEITKDMTTLTLEELELHNAVASETLEHTKALVFYARITSSNYQNEAEKCNAGVATCEEARERAESRLIEERKLSTLWEERARKLGWKDSRRLFS